MAPKTPLKKRLGPCPLTGEEVVVPGNIFKTPSKEGCELGSGPRARSPRAAAPLSRAALQRARCARAPAVAAAPRARARPQRLDHGAPAAAA